jgi:hypothetical protein
MCDVTEHQAADESSHFFLTFHFVPHLTKLGYAVESEGVIVLSDLAQ